MVETNGETSVDPGHDVFTRVQGFRRSTWSHLLDALKSVNCCSRAEWEAALDVKSWSYPEEFESIWIAYKRFGLFEALCMLDHNNLNLLMEYADRKYL